MFNFKYKAFLSELGTISRGVGAGPCVQSCGHGPGLELALAEVWAVGAEPSENNAAHSWVNDCKTAFWIWRSFRAEYLHFLNFSNIRLTKCVDKNVHLSSVSVYLKCDG